MNKINHIAIFIPSLMGGGAERMMVNLANDFSNQGYSVDLIVSVLQGPYINRLSSAVNIVNLKSNRALKSLIPLAKYLKNKKPDVILSALTYVNIVTLIAKIISFSKTKVFVSERSVFSSSCSSLNLPAINIFLYKKIIKITYSMAEKIICISDAVKNDFIKEINIKNNKLITIYNPAFDSDVLKKSHERISHPWLCNTQLFLVVGVGRLNQVKDFATLIKSFKKVLENKKNLRLIILGEGNLRNNLELLVKDLGIENFVSMPGFVNNPYAYMRSANVFVLSSLYEGFGNVIVEAMACNTPVISTNCPGGPAEILENGKWGKLVPVGDIDTMALAISEILTNPNKTYNSYERALHFTSENIANHYLKTFTNQL